MTDIVEQLLADADWLGSETARKPAIEIKRLRAEVEQWKERYEAERAPTMGPGTAAVEGTMDPCEMAR